MSTTKSKKVIDAQTEVKAAGQELEEKRSSDGCEASSQRPDAQVQNENDVKVAQIYVTIEKKIRFEAKLPAAKS